MANVYSWEIERLAAYPEVAGNQDVVCFASWRLNADDGAGHFATIAGQQEIEIKADEPFTPYDQLTKDQVVSWIKAEMAKEVNYVGKDLPPEPNDRYVRLVAQLDAEIAEQVNPTIVVKPLPWDAK